MDKKEHRQRAAEAYLKRYLQRKHPERARHRKPQEQTPSKEVPSMPMNENYVAGDDNYPGKGLGNRVARQHAEYERLYGERFSGTSRVDGKGYFDALSKAVTEGQEEERRNKDRGRQ